MERFQEKQSTMDRRSFLRIILSSFLLLFLSGGYSILRESEKMKNKVKEICDFLKGEGKDTKLRIYGREFDYDEFSEFILNVLKNKYTGLELDKKMVQQIMRCYSAFLWVDINYEESFNINPLLENLNLNINISKNMSYGPAQIQAGRAKETVKEFRTRIKTAVEYLNKGSKDGTGICFLDIDGLLKIADEKEIVQALDLQGNGSIFCGLLAFADSYLKYLERLLQNSKDSNNKESKMDKFNLFALSIAEYVGGPNSAEICYKRNINTDSNSESKMDLGKRFLTLRYVMVNLYESKDIPPDIKEKLKKMYASYIRSREMDIVYVLSNPDIMREKLGIEDENIINSLMDNIKKWIKEGIEREDVYGALVPVFYRPQRYWGLIDSQNIILKIILSWNEYKDKKRE